MIQTFIKLRCCGFADQRPYRTGRTAQIEPMAASIEAKGVLQNSSVTPKSRRAATFEVFDGGRRWRALACSPSAVRSRKPISMSPS